MIHSFETRVAEEVGLNSAVILNNLYYWVEKNRANGKNFYDGYYWTYNSRKAFVELFPYFSERQIEHAIQKLIEKQLVIIGNYNEDKRERTLWYAITPKGYALITGQPLESSESPVISISQKCEMQKTEMLNAENENVKCIISSSNNKTTNRKRNNIIDENFECLWKMLEPTPHDRKSKVSAKRKKELFEMGKSRTENAIKLYLKTKLSQYTYRRDNFLNEVIDNYLDKNESDFDTARNQSRRKPSLGEDFEPSYNIDDYEANYMYI